MATPQQDGNNSNTPLSGQTQHRISPNQTNRIGHTSTAAIFERNYGSINKPLTQPESNVFSHQPQQYTDPTPVNTPGPSNNSRSPESLPSIRSLLYTVPGPSPPFGAASLPSAPEDNFISPHRQPFTGLSPVNTYGLPNNARSPESFHSAWSLVVMGPGPSPPFDAASLPSAPEGNVFSHQPQQYTSPTPVNTPGLSNNAHSPESVPSVPSLLDIVPGPSPPLHTASPVPSAGSALHPPMSSFDAESVHYNAVPSKPREPGQSSSGTRIGHPTAAQSPPRFDKPIPSASVCGPPPRPTPSNGLSTFQASHQAAAEFFAAPQPRVYETIRMMAPYHAWSILEHRVLMHELDRHNSPQRIFLSASKMYQAAAAFISEKMTPESKVSASSVGAKCYEMVLSGNHRPEKINDRWLEEDQAAFLTEFLLNYGDSHQQQEGRTWIHTRGLEKRDLKRLVDDEGDEEGEPSSSKKRRM